MNKKGFTLVEILSVIILISLLLGIGIPGVQRISARMKEKSYNTKINLIEQAGTLWGQDNKTRLYETASCEIKENENNSAGTYSCRKKRIYELIEEDYLKYDTEKKDSEGNITYEYIDPRNNNNITDRCVYIYKKNNRVYAFYNEENTC